MLLSFPMVTGNKREAELSKQKQDLDPYSKKKRWSQVIYF